MRTSDFPVLLDMHGRLARVFTIVQREAHRLPGKRLYVAINLVQIVFPSDGAREALRE